jgi:hypothetical protein
MTRKFVQFTFLHLLCRENRVTKLCDLFVYWLSKYNSSVLQCIEYSAKNKLNHKKNLSHYAYIHETRLSHNMRKSSV